MKRTVIWLASLIFGIGAVTYGSTVLTTNSSNTLDTFRTNTNTSLTNLNTDKLESGSKAGTLTLGSLTVGSATLGSLTSTSTATSTFAGGIQSVCFSVDGINCLSSSGSSASSTLLGDTNTWTGPQAFRNLTASNATSTNLTATGLGLFGDVGGVYNYSMGSGAGTIGFNSNGYVAGVNGFGALFQLAPSTGVFTMFLESNVSAGAAHSHTTTLQWDGTGIVYIPQGFVANASSTIGTLHLGTPLTVGNGGTGASTLTGLLQGNGTSAFTGISNSSTAGQVLRVTGASTYAWGALDLANTNAITGTLPVANGGTGVTATSSIYTFSPAFSNGATLGINTQPSINFATSTWSGTTTQAILLPTIAGSIIAVRCEVKPDGATLNVQFGFGTATSTMLTASSTSNINLFTTNNTFSSGGRVVIAVGTPASSPKSILCNPEITY